MLFLDLRTSYIVKILLILYLIPTKTQKKISNFTGKCKFWKPSLLESVSAFATHVTASKKKTIIYIITYG